MSASAWSERAGLLLRRHRSLGTIFDGLARIDARRPLVVELVGDGDPADAIAPMTVDEAATRVRRIAGGIADRCRPGDRVVVAIANSYEVLLTSVAVARAGCVAVPVNAMMTDAEVEHVVADSGAALVIDDAGAVLGDAVDPVIPGRDDVAAIFYTSGTTGVPKGARITHEGLLAQLAGAAAWPRWARREEAVVGLPAAHIMGFVVLLALAVAGIPVAFLRRFRPDAVLDAIEQRRATIFVGVPAMYRMLLGAGAEHRDLRSIHVFASGADVMPDDLARRFQRMGSTATLPLLGPIGEAAFVDGYGLVEAGGSVAIGVRPPNVPFTTRGLAMPVPGYRVRVVGDAGDDVAVGEVGELWVKGPGVLAGYQGADDGAAGVLTADGWLRTGDLVRRGLFGLNVFAGREKDIIKHGGYSVAPVEVELAVGTHPAVAEAVVVGLPDERLGETVAAVVRLRDGHAASVEEIIEWAHARLAPYKVPRSVYFVDDLPRTGTEKVRRRQLREMIERSIDGAA